MRQFLRADTNRYSRLGSRRKKLRKWRRPRGKHNKLRLKRFSYPIQPGIGFGNQGKDAGKVNGLIPVHVGRISDLKALGKNNIIIISRRLGAKKKVELLRKASEMSIKIANAGGKR